MTWYGQNRLRAGIVFGTVAVTVDESSREDPKLRQAVLILELLPMPRRGVVT